jgi:hypothetical protein
MFPRVLLRQILQPLGALYREDNALACSLDSYRLAKFVFSPTLEHRVLFGRGLDAVLDSLTSSSSGAPTEVFNDSSARELIRSNIVELYDREQLLRARLNEEVELSRISSRGIQNNVRVGTYADFLVVPSSSAIMKLYGRPYKTRFLIGGVPLSDDTPEPPSTLRLVLA